MSFSKKEDFLHLQPVFAIQEYGFRATGFSKFSRGAGYSGFLYTFVTGLHHLGQTNISWL